VTRFDCLALGNTALIVGGGWLIMKIVAWDNRRRARRTHRGGVDL
jgi:hypothetical protein